MRLTVSCEPRASVIHRRSALRMTMASMRSASNGTAHDRRRWWPERVEASA